ncbi:MAG: hypothetical protein ABR604_10095 [Jatrophihabitantaceae bacterium]
MNNGASTSHVDNGSYSLVTAAANGQAVFDLSGQLRVGSIHVTKGAVLTTQSAQNLYYSVILVIQDQAGEYQELTMQASGEPATTDCTLTIDTATTTDVTGKLSCPNVATKDGRYAYAVDLDFAFTK